MQRNRKQEKAQRNDKDIKDNNIEVIVNIGNENNDESEKNSNSDNITETVNPGLKQNEEIMNELLDKLKSKIKEFNKKKEELINRKIDIPNDIFSLPDLEINSKEDILQLMDVLQNKINSLNNLLIKPFPLANQISYQRGADLNVQPQENYIPFAGLRPSDFYRPEAYTTGDFISDRDAQNNEPVQPEIPVLPDEQIPVLPDEQIPDEPDQPEILEPIDPPPLVPELPRDSDFDEFGPTVDPDSDYEDDADEIVPVQEVSPYLESLESRKFILTQYINSQLPTDYDRSKNVRAMIANENANAYNEINKAIGNIDLLTETEYKYLMNLFVTQDITPQGDLPSAVAYRHYTTEPLDFENGLISARLVELPGGTLANPNARRIFQLVINDDIRVDNYFFTIDGDLYDEEDENMNSSNMEDVGIGEGSRRPGGRNSSEFDPNNENNKIQAPSVNPNPIFENPIDYQDDGGLANIDFSTGGGLFSTIGNFISP